MQVDPAICAVIPLFLGKGLIYLGLNKLVSMALQDETNLRSMNL
jgi:hypothetical protein